MAAVVKQTYIENRLMDMGRREERVRGMERIICKLTLPYVKYIVNGNLLYGSGNSNRRCIYLDMCAGREMRRRFKRDGIYEYLWLLLVEV